jgi:hypothetical protein
MLRALGDGQRLFRLQWSENGRNEADQRARLVKRNLVGRFHETYKYLVLNAERWPDRSRTVGVMALPFVFVAREYFLEPQFYHPDQGDVQALLRQGRCDMPWWTERNSTLQKIMSS